MNTVNIKYGYQAYKMKDIELLQMLKTKQMRWSEEIPYEKKRYNHHISYLKKKVQTQLKNKMERLNECIKSLYISPVIPYICKDIISYCIQEYI